MSSSFCLHAQDGKSVHPEHITTPAKQLNLRRSQVVAVVEENQAGVVRIVTRQVLRQRVIVTDTNTSNPISPEQVKHRDVELTQLGSGFIVHHKGWVVTSGHVVSGAQGIEVILYNGKVFQAELIFMDLQQDVALLRLINLKGQSLKALKLGQSADLMPGEPAIALAYPKGLGQTVSLGVISSRVKSLSLSTEHILERVIQSDVAVNPGSSGGPLLNAYGQVIGMITAQGVDRENLSFAVAIEALTDRWVEMMNLDIRKGISVPGEFYEKYYSDGKTTHQREVYFHTGKVTPLRVEQVNGQEVDGLLDLLIYLDDMRVGQFLVLNEGEGAIRLKVKASVQARKREQLFQWVGARLKATRLKKHKVTGSGFDLRGLRVEAIKSQGRLAEAGVLKGDVLIQVGSTSVKSISALMKLSRDYAGRRSVDVILWRSGEMMSMKVDFSEQDLESRTITISREKP